MSTNQALPVQFHMDINCCAYYGGKAFRPRFDLRFRPNEVFDIEFSYQPNFIRLPTGNVDIHVGTIEGLVNLTPDMQFAMQAQYDNISGSFGFLGRYRWEFRPGTELFVAIGQSAFIPGTEIHGGVPPEIQTTTVSIRLGHTFQF
jgi:hypothetical protein